MMFQTLETITLAAGANAVIAPVHAKVPVILTRDEETRLVDARAMGRSEDCNDAAG
jgi:putative SOS response-associated peptidase YedK